MQDSSLVVAVHSPDAVASAADRRIARTLYQPEHPCPDCGKLVWCGWDFERRTSRSLERVAPGRRGTVTLIHPLPGQYVVRGQGLIRFLGWGGDFVVHSCTPAPKAAQEIAEGWDGWIDGTSDQEIRQSRSDFAKPSWAQVFEAIRWPAGRTWDEVLGGAS